MPYSATFVATCRTRLEASAELTAFRTGYVVSSTDSDGRRSQWNQLYGSDVNGSNPARRLRQAIRGIVNAEADIHGAVGSGVVSLNERETVIQTLVAEYVPMVARPLPREVEADEFARAVSEG